MSVNFVPKLQMMANVQIALPILNNPDMRYLIDCYSPGDQFDKNIEVCSMIEKAAMKKIQSLALASTMTKAVKNCIMNMFSQIIESKYTYSLALSKCTSHVNKHFKFVWKQDGTLDQKNTVKSLIEDQDLNIKERFVLASRFCLIDEALFLWKSMKDERKCFSLLELECHPLVNMWIEMFEEGSSREEITAEILESSVLQNNVSTLRYVMQILPFEKRRPYLLRTALKRNVNTDVMVFCLSGLEKSDQETVFKNSPAKVLQGMLSWPYQSLFSCVAAHLWTFLSKDSFYHILCFILRTIDSREWSDFGLIELLKEFWFESPVHFKEYVKQKFIFRPLQVVLSSDMDSFPRRELQQAFIQSLEEYICRLCP